MIGVNEKITADTVTEIFGNLCLTEVIDHCYSDTDLVTTYQIVSHHIDGIYTSITLQVSAGGYLRFGIISSDHRLLWLKIEFDSGFGATMDPLVPHTKRNLNFQKPTP